MLLIKTKVAPSEIKGLGLFADQDIKAGTLIWQFVPPFDISIDRDIRNKIPEIARQQFLKYAFLSIKTGRYILCFDDDRFFNHSESPNVASSDIGGEEGSAIALRDIELGEELTCSYLEFDADTLRKLY